MAYLTELAGGDPAIIKEILVLFLDQTPSDVAKLGAHIANGDWPATHLIAHHIKPTLSYVGAERIRLEIQEIEQTAKQPEGDKQQISARFDALSSRFELLFAELKGYLDSL